MIRLEIKRYKTILPDKQQIYLHYYQVKLINMKILQAKTYNLQIFIIEQSQIIEQVNFTYSPIKKL